MNTRIPHTLTHNQPRKPLFAHHPAGGVRLDVPVYAAELGQLARVHRRGVSLDLFAAVDSDHFLERHPAGGVRIRLAE